LPVAVSVLHPQDVGRAGHDQFALPRLQPIDLQNLFSENYNAFVFAVSVIVFEHSDARAGRFARRRIVRVIEHYNDVDAPILIKDHLDRTHHLWLIQKDLDLEIFAQFHLRERFLGSIGTLFGLFALLAREQFEKFCHILVTPSMPQFHCSLILHISRRTADVILLRLLDQFFNLFNDQG
jgi:hypothetical protein